MGSYKMRMLWLSLLLIASSQGEDVADVATTTPNGCQCTSKCGASIGDVFSTDWCFTADSCGQYKLPWHYWDYCLYLNSQKPGYVNMTWNEKQNQLWDLIEADNNFGTYHATEMPTESVKTTFDDEWDVMPNGRNKVIHSVGAICPFKIDIAENSNYTGLLKASSTTYGLIRMGPATDPYSSGSGRDLVPGIGVKFLRTGVNSANFMLLHSLEPLPENNFNFFAETMSNHIPAEANSLQLKLMVQKFCQTGHCLSKVGISHLTTYDQDGNTVEEPKFPFKFSFQSADVTFSETAPETFEKFMGQFTNISMGTTLYNVMAHSSPSDQDGSFLGSVVTTNSCVTSNFGDTKLFFRHRPIGEDADMREEWRTEYETGCGIEDCH